MGISDETSTRVEEHSSSKASRRIDALNRARVLDLADRLEDIERRLCELDSEWDIERTLEANAAVATLIGSLLGPRWRGFRLLPIVVGAFLLVHAVQGWCPPIPLFRKLGVRTMREIDQERYALKALRGDFEKMPSDGDVKARADAAIEAASYGGEQT